LNTMMSALLILLTVLFSKSGSLIVSHIGALLCGLALCNQHTIILFEVPLIAWMLFLLRQKISSNYFYLVSHAGLTLIGLSFYLYLPIVSIISPKAGSW
jgi:hypothetical protein